MRFFRRSALETAGSEAAFFKVLLVIFFCPVKRFCVNDLRNNWLVILPGFFKSGFRYLGGSFLFGRVIENNRTVLSTDIRPLAV